MKISVLQQDLLPCLQAVARSVGVRSTLPVLSNILFASENAKLKIAATNLEIGVIEYVPSEVIEQGDITVPAKTIVEIVSGLPASKIEIETKGDNMHLSSGKFKATINGIAALEFPAIPLSEGEGIKLPKEVLVSSSQILFATAVDEGRPTLTGVLTEASKGMVDLVATDGFRLAHRKINLPDSSVSFKSLIPRRTFDEIIRVLSEVEADDVEVATSSGGNQIIFKIGQVILSSRLIEGNFPSWQKIIPEKITTRALLDKEELLKAVKLASVFAKNEANVITFSVGSGKISLSSQAKELGGQENEVESQIEGEDLKIAFNAKFLLDAVSNCPTSQLSLEFSGPLSAAIIKPVGLEGLEYIIMPVRLS